MDTNYILVILMFVTFIGLLFTGIPVGYVLRSEERRVGKECRL